MRQIYAWINGSVNPLSATAHMRERPIALFKYCLLRRRKFLIRPNHSSLTITFMFNCCCASKTDVADTRLFYLQSTLSSTQPIVLSLCSLHLLQQCAIWVGSLENKNNSRRNQDNKIPYISSYCNFGRDILG